MAQVGYSLDDGTVVNFEFQPGDDFRPVSANAVVAKVRDAAAPVLEAARIVLDKATEGAPAAVEIKFGIKVTGMANWGIAKASTDGTFEVTLKWARSDHQEPSASAAP